MHSLSRFSDIRELELFLFGCAVSEEYNRHQRRNPRALDNRGTFVGYIEIDFETGDLKTYDLTGKVDGPARE